MAAFSTIAALGTAALAAGGSIIGGNKQKQAAQTAADAQTQSAQMGIDETRRQFDAVQALLKPYVEAGGPALQAQLGLMGLNGAQAQQQQINQLEQSPLYQSLAQQGENAILQNASATGGLRGGNTQAALAQFRPAMLDNLINQQLSRYGSIAKLGQNSAAGVGDTGMSVANTVSNLLGQQGAAQAGLSLAQGNAANNTLNGVVNAIGAAIPTVGGLFGGASSPINDIVLSNSGTGLARGF